MKKNFLLLFVFAIILSACEKDDFCLKNPVTPKLVITFYDNTNRDTSKKVQRLSIIANSKTDSLITNQSSDSIAIPLNTLATETIYTLKKNATDGTKANNEYVKFSIKYTPKSEYVSRSCGYKVVFNNVTFLSEVNTWIKDFTPSTLVTIDNQNAAHVQIFH